MHSNIYLCTFMFMLCYHINNVELPFVDLGAIIRLLIDLIDCASNVEKLNKLIMMKLNILCSTYYYITIINIQFWIHTYQEVHEYEYKIILIFSFCRIESFELYLFTIRMQFEYKMWAKLMKCSVFASLLNATHKPLPHSLSTYICTFVWWIILNVDMSSMSKSII